MAVRLNKPWRDLIPETVSGIAGHLGVYELANAAGEVVYIGAADARTRFGLREELQAALNNPPAGAVRFRVEVTMAYHTRRAELLGAYLYDFGQLPAGNGAVDPAAVGRLRPGGGPGPVHGITHKEAG